MVQRAISQAAVIVDRSVPSRGQGLPGVVVSVTSVKVRRYCDGDRLTWPLELDAEVGRAAQAAVLRDPIDG
jgi:hypothetical protein